MRQLISENLTALLADHEPPCVSLYQPTHRRHPENQQDPIRYRNLLQRMESSLRAKYPSQEVEAVMEKFEALARDNHFWKNRTDGLAILGSREFFHLFELQRPVKELLIVADSFHIKPLLRVLQSADRFQILCLNRQEAKLFEGNRYALDRVELTDVPSTITAALGQELTEQHLTVSSYGGVGGSGSQPMHHGHGSKKDEAEIDTLRFFRVVDRGIMDHHSRPSGLPLMLAALPEYHTTFRHVSHNPFLMEAGLTVNPEALSLDELRVQAWQKIEPYYLHRLAKLVESFHVARSRQQGADDVTEVARATLAGRVSVLLVEAERQIPGRINAATGQIEIGSQTDPEIDDILDDLAVETLRMKGEVVVVPAERMPVKTGVAATFRY